MLRSYFNLLIPLVVGIMSGPLHSQTAVIPTAGDGSSGNPYEIATLGNLYWIAMDTLHWKYNYIQTADINAAETKNWFNDSGWTPIGNNTTYFTGKYNGKGHLIDSLYINRPESSFIGLLGVIDRSDSCVDRLGLTRLNVTGKSFVGGLVGMSNAIISNCYCTGNISGASALGGLMGGNYLGMVISCYSLGVVNGVINTGGLIGMTSKGEINNCYSISNVRCFSSGDDVGGLLGSNSQGTISNCFSAGNISGNISGYSIGGLIGNDHKGTVSNSFWDTQSSGLDTSASGTGKTTAEMKIASTFTSAGWDFINETANGTDDIWGINSSDNFGYPFLKWQVFVKEQISISVKQHNFSNVILKRKGMLLFSKTEIIQLVNLSGKNVRESRTINGSQSLSLIGLPRGIYIARSGKESLCIENFR